MTRTTLPPEARMHRPSEFAAALKGRRLARGAFFMISAAKPGDLPDRTEATCANAAAVAACARLGLVIPKRHAARASTRNALKRVIREAFRAQRLRLGPADYVVRLHSRVPDMSLTALKKLARAEADAHFQRLTQGQPARAKGAPAKRSAASSSSPSQGAGQPQPSRVPDAAAADMPASHPERKAS